EAIVASSSACGAMLNDYGRLLDDDPAYAEKARRVAALAKDIGEVVAGLEPGGTRPGAGRRIAFHAPCSLQHGLRLHRTVEGALAARGFELTPVPDAHL